MVKIRSRWLSERLSTDRSKRRMLAVGVMVLLVALAGCGGSPDNSETTGVTSGTATPADGVEMGPGTATEGDGEATSTAAPAETEAVNLSVAPASANTTNATLLVRATVDEASASDGLENVTVDTGGGLDLGNVTTADVDTAGIDTGGVLPGNETSESLAANVDEVRRADDGRTLTIALDGNESVAAGDEIVAVIDGGVTTTTPGNYSFDLTIDGGPTRTGNYTVAAA
ncbi:hypothetical protein [Halococcus qingdaonensis]|uniref:hypothetical protein n=1 Tax=Halococcus qingdaonensis TaxID=224402 RepID=UPI002115D306|nr:hypothetical protein [Halococcus qingdaonensis]